VNCFHRTATCGKLREDFTSTVAPPGPAKLHKVRMQQLLETVSVLPSLEKMELRFQSTQMLEQIADLHKSPNG
jgi:hypothetical protein